MNSSSVGATSLAQYSSTLFQKIDTQKKGYLEVADLSAALGTQNSTSDSGTKALFSVLDSNSDGKVTESELGNGLKNLADALFRDLRSAGVQGHDGGPRLPPPPEGGDDAGLTKEQLTAVADKAQSSDPRAQGLADLVQNFDVADSNGDGKVSRAEAHTYEEQKHATSDQPSTLTTASTIADNGMDAQLLRSLAQLLSAYGQGDSATSATSGSLLGTA